MLTTEGAKILLASAVSVVFTILLGVNAFFITRLVDKMDSTESSVHRLEIKVAVISKILQNGAEPEETAFKETRDARQTWYREAKGTGWLRPVGW